MKLKGMKKSELDILGGESKKFSVDTEDTMIIRLLRDKMYKNKVGAVCREIASNGRDANREAGRGKTPIEITISRNSNDILSDEESAISFKDNGIGVTPDRMEKIFLKYGGSTKRDSDKFTGGFGIGAKTPFAYTDNFFIITICEVDGKRMKFYYQAAITGDGKQESSQMISLGEEETNEPTGTTIEVPIKLEDVEKFEYETLYATSFWKVKPILKGFRIKDHYKIEVVHKGKQPFTVVTDVNNLYGEYASFVALIDEIPYVLDLNKLKGSGIGENPDRGYYGGNNRNKFLTLFHFETSEVTVSGSREDIEYIEENISKFTQVNKKMKNEIKGHIDSYLKKADSYYDRCVRANKIASGGNGYGSNELFKEGEDFIKLMSELYPNVGITRDEIYGTYNGHKVEGSHRLGLHNLDIYKTKASNGKISNVGSLNGAQYGSEKFNLPIYYLDLAKAEPTRNAMLKKLHGETGYILVKKVKFDDDDTERQEQFEKEQKILDLIGLKGKWKLYSEVEKLRKVGDGKRNITDLVKVTSRWLKNPNSWNKSWVSIKPTFDKSEKEFTDIMEVAQKQNVMPNCKGIAYFTVEKLSDLDGTSYSTPTGMTSNQSVIHSILTKNDILVIAVSNSKAKYFNQAKIPTMEKSFEKLMKSEGDNVQSLKNAIDFNYASKNKANSIYFELDFGKENNKSLEALKKLMKLAKEDKIRKSDLKIVGGIDKEFAETYNFGVSKEVKEAIDTLNEVKKKNPIVALYVDAQRFDSHFESGLLKKSKEQIIELLKSANK